MNKKQKNVLLITAILLGIVLIFPPFHHIGSEGREFGMGYSFILSPPRFSQSHYATIDSAALFVIALIIILIGSVVFYFFRGSEEIKQDIPKEKNQVNRPLRYFLFILLFFLFGYASLVMKNTDQYSREIALLQAQQHSGDLQEIQKIDRSYAFGAGIKRIVVNTIFIGLGYSIWRFTRKK
jgi:hypothetical protein